MSISSIELNQLLDTEQVDRFLKSIVEIVPHILLVTDLDGNVLGSAGSMKHLQEIIKGNIDLFDLGDTDSSKTSDKSYVKVRAPLYIRDQHVGYVFGVSSASTPHITESITATAELTSQILTDQAYKEYELNSLSTEVLSKYEELTLLYELTQDLGAVFDSPTICQIALDRATHIVTAEKAYIALMDEDQQHLTVMAAQGMETFVGQKLSTDEGITGYVATSGKQVLLEKEEIFPNRPPSEGTPLEAVLSLPLTIPIDRAEDKRGVLGVVMMVGKPSGQMFTTGEAKLLTTIMTQISVAIYNTQLVHAQQDAERIQQQIEIAARIQQSLLPKQPPQLSGVTLAGRCISAVNVGGDYYDIFVDNAGFLTMVIADVSGHSIGSALLMAMARSTLRYEVSLGKPLSAVLADTNITMFNDLIQAEMFISVFCARYDPDTHRLTFANGGHNPPLLWQAANKQIIDLDTDGLILGILDDVSYEEQVNTLHPGDILVLFTDGIIEARNPDGEQFGGDRLRTLLRKNTSLTPDALADQIYLATHQYSQNTLQQDDMTLLILKVKEEE